MDRGSITSGGERKIPSVIVVKGGGLTVKNQVKIKGSYCVSINAKGGECWKIVVIDVTSYEHFGRYNSGGVEQLESRNILESRSVEASKSHQSLDQRKNWKQCESLDQTTMIQEGDMWQKTNMTCGPINS
jgi:hypothetical protein